MRSSYFNIFVSLLVIVMLKSDLRPQLRNNCFNVDNMNQLFQDIHIDSIMTFLRQIDLFNK